MIRAAFVLLTVALSSAVHAETPCNQVGANTDFIGVVLFSEGAAGVSQVERARLLALAQFASKMQYNRLLVVGHADELGSVGGNDILARRRAETVSAILTPAAGQMALDVITCGEARPVLPTGGRPHPHNRRVEIRGVR